jgi:hypothetical protein
MHGTLLKVSFRNLRLGLTGRSHKDMWHVKMPVELYGINYGVRRRQNMRWHLVVHNRTPKLELRYKCDFCGREWLV